MTYAVDSNVILDILYDVFCASGSRPSRSSIRPNLRLAEKWLDRDGNLKEEKRPRADGGNIHDAAEPVNPFGLS